MQLRGAGYIGLVGYVYSLTLCGVFTSEESMKSFVLLHMALILWYGLFNDAPHSPVSLVVERLPGSVRVIKIKTFFWTSVR